ncbi:MAG: HNH endonuclease [Candidatus Pacebacteria bacterium]|nr:HNH endonuclease [Candidatus Paceibacterota bacterium]
MSRALVILNSAAERQKATGWIAKAPPGTRVKHCKQCDKQFSKDPRYSSKYWTKQLFCSRTCYGQWHSDFAAKNREDESTAFMKWVEKSETCWLWTGAIDSDGYGAFSYAMTTKRAHREALRLSGVPVPKGAFVCHNCDNPTCVNPNHLYVGTPQSNVEDAVARDRICKGEKVHFSKLTEASVVQIRAAVGTHEQIAVVFGISPANVSMIRTRKTWRHVP